MEKPLLLTVPQAARLVQLSRAKLYEEMAAGKIESVTVGRARRIPRSAIDVYIRRLRQKE